MKRLAILGVLALAACDRNVEDADRSALKWESLPPLSDPLGFAGPFAGVSGDALIVAGGANFPGEDKVWHDRIFVLPKPDGKWKEIPEKLPRPIGYGVAVTLDNDGGVLCLGGGDKERHYDDVFLLKWADERLEIEKYPPMPGAAAFFCGARVGDTVYVSGGREVPDSPKPLNTLWALDLKKREWNVLDPCPGRARFLAVAGTQDGAFFLMSGADLVPGEDGKPTREFLKDGWRYKDGKWKPIRDLPRSAVAAPTPAPALGHAHLLVIGGDDGTVFKGDHPGFTPEILAYHTVTDTWRKLGEFPKDPAGGVWPPVTTVTTKWDKRWIIPTGEARPRIRTTGVMAFEPAKATLSFAGLDYAVLVAYLAGLVIMGFFFSKRAKTTDDYFRGGRRVPWWAAGLSIYGTMLSAITFMALPALVYRTDWVYFLGNVMILAAAPIVVYFYLPFFRRLDVTSAYEYLEKRFNLGIRHVASLQFLLFQLGRMGIVLYLPALALSTVTGVDIYVCVILMGVLATVYTVLGGIEAVVWTDVLQVFVLLGGALLSLGIIVAGTEGGVTGIISAGAEAGKFRQVVWSWDIATTAIWVVVIGKLLEQLVPYTADQTVVQRYLTTPDEKKAAKAIWTNGIMCVPGSAVFFALGTGLWAFYRSNPDLLNPVGRSDDILAWFIVQQLPAGLAGLVLAGLFAASMSSLDSSMNSMSTAVITDFYRRLRPKIDDRRCLILARRLTVVFGIFGTGTALLMAAIQSKSMWDQYIKIVGLFGGGLAGLFAAGIFTRRANAPGMLLGFVSSAAFLYWLRDSGHVHFFLYAAAGIVACGAVGWAASALFPEASKDVTGLTIHTLAAAGKDR